MIDNNKIKEAIEDYVRHSSVEDEYPGTEEDAFKAGAKWAINEFLKDLWHPNTEEPEENRNILIEHKCGDLLYHTEEYDCYYDDPWDFKVRILNITRWLYIDDLLPKEEDTYD